MTGEECEAEDLSGGQNDTADCVAVGVFGAGTGEVTGDGVAGLTGDEREDSAGVHEGVGGVACVGVGPGAVAHAGVDGDFDVWDLV